MPLTNRILTAAGVLAVPVLLAVASQALSQTAGAPEVGEEVIVVTVEPAAEGAEPVPEGQPEAPAAPAPQAPAPEPAAPQPAPAEPAPAPPAPAPPAPAPVAPVAPPVVGDDFDDDFDDDAADGGDD
jgi:hypothetical protein